MGRISTVPTLARVNFGETSAFGVQRSAFSGASAFACGVPNVWCSIALHSKNRTIISVSKVNPASEEIPGFQNE